MSGSTDAAVLTHSAAHMRTPNGRARVGWKPVSADRRVASARIRCLNPLRVLRARGYPIELFDPATASDYEVVVYSKLYDDRTRLEAQQLRRSGTRIVLDLCDNHLYVPDPKPELIRAAAGLRAMAGIANVIVASTEALAEALHEELDCPPPITVIGDAVETGLQGEFRNPWRQVRHGAALARLRRALREAGIPPEGRLVWFGVAAGPRGCYGLRDLLAQRELLQELGGEFRLGLTVISNSRAMYRQYVAPWSLPTFYLEWAAETFETALREHAIAIIPVLSTPFTRCKTNNRVTTALAAGLAVVADGIPSYRPFANACSLDDWRNGLTRYLADPDSRRRDVAAGRELIDHHWSPNVIADQWESLFAGLLRD